MARGTRHASLVAATLALAGPLAACQRSAGLAPIGQIQIRATELAPALADAGIDGAVTLASARGALEASGFRLDQRALRSYRATIEVVAVSVIPGAAGTPPSAEVVLEVWLERTWAEGPVARRSGRGKAALSGGPRSAAWRGALGAALTEAAAALALDLKALGRPRGALLADLGSGDPRARERAVRALASRGDLGSARAVERLIRDPDRAVARAAVETLAAFKDPSSTRALIEAAQAGDAATTLSLLPVLLEIGGPDVEGYLLTLEAGHGDAAVRSAAGQALASFRARRPGAGPTR